MARVNAKTIYTVRHVYLTQASNQGERWGEKLLKKIFRSPWKNLLDIF